MELRICSSHSLKGKIEVAGDKSISHRSIILGALSVGQTEVEGLLEGEDVLATIAAFRQMGVSIRRASKQERDNHYLIDGVGLNGLRPAERTLDLGNSGTAFRLITGLLAAQPWCSRLTGDVSLCRRPMQRIITPLSKMGAQIQSTNHCPPIKILGNKRVSLSAITYDIPVASAQVKSAILLAAMYAEGKTVVTECGITRDHTERMMQGFGYAVDTQGMTLELSGGGTLTGQNIVVPGDLSSAAFFILAGLIVADSALTLCNIGNNPSRNGVITILQRMGGNIRVDKHKDVSGEPTCDIHVYTSELRGIDISADDVALAVDEIPVIAVAAAFAKGVTVITGAAELKVKESDRIVSTVEALRKLGIDVKQLGDGMIIQGGEMKSGVVDSHDDHRIAMAFAIAGAAVNTGVTVKNCQNIATSFPNFTQLISDIGININ